MGQNQILICLVIYNEVINNTKAYKSLVIHNVNNTFIYDNSTDILLNKNSSTSKGYFHDSYNSGLSKAYNFAAKYAKDKGYKWILLTDQDTFFPENAIEIYYNAIENNPDIKLFLPRVKIGNGGFMSPVKSIHYFSKIAMQCPLGIINPEKYSIINSGLCINIDAFFKVGGYNEKVWLDFADIQFIERFANKYDKAYVLDLECIQSFSNEEQDISQKINRYKLFCNSIKHYESTNRFNKFWIFCIVLKRALSLSRQSKSFKPFSIFAKYYIS